MQDKDNNSHSPAMPPPSPAAIGEHQTQPCILLNALNFAPAPGKRGFWPPTLPAAFSSPRYSPRSLGEGLAVPPAHLTESASLSLRLSPHGGGLSDPIALNQFQKGWLCLCGLFISKSFPHLSSQFSTVLLLDFCSCKLWALLFARASSLIPQHTNGARGGNRPCGLNSHRKPLSSPQQKHWEASWKKQWVQASTDWTHPIQYPWT